jgi:ferredoxin
VAAIGPATDENGERSGAVAESLCLGCGACIPACRRDALALSERKERPIPPESRKDLFRRLLKEKGRLTPYVVSGMKKKLLRALGRKR